jgi:hypothetical protein
VWMFIKEIRRLLVFQHMTCCAKFHIKNKKYNVTTMYYGEQNHTVVFTLERRRRKEGVSFVGFMSKHEFSVQFYSVILVCDFTFILACIFFGHV